VSEQVQLGDLAVDVIRKDIKNIHLSVHPPTGRVSIAAPSRMSLEMLRIFAISKLSWIRQQQHKLQDQDRESPREYLNRESHYLWGKRYLLKLTELDAAPVIHLKHISLLLQLRPGASDEKKRAVLEEWYRKQLKAELPALIEKWQRLIGVKAERFHVRRMKTKWGSCSPESSSIRLNTELAKKPRECLEYIVVHELLHLLEPTHNARFVALMDHYLPKWQSCRQLLNRLPVRHESWSY
jgi:predicted metal-dependent hydrolase